VTTAIEVTELAPDQVGEAGLVLARAFHDDPFEMWLLPDDSKRARVLAWFSEVWVRYCWKYGQVYTTAGKVEGVAAWLPPGRFPASRLRLMVMGMVLAPLKLGLAGFSRFMSSANYMDQLHERDVPPRHWYLPTLGVDPPRQGQGMGSALIQPALALADASGLPCYLETQRERNVLFYQRHGFEVVVEDDLPRGGPHFWTMKRQAKG
jgi:ribosomal protein S18 acetylase RimI-like enzyme